jgi:hypothetical protein
LSAAVATSIQKQIARCGSWPDRFHPEEWAIYKQVIRRARESGIRFAIGGGLAAMTYAGQWRNTKDLDIYIKSADKGGMQEILSSLGLEDYYSVHAYDRNWIYRSHKGETIVDVMWAMANQRATVDDSWMEGPEVEADGERFRLLAPEDALWSKLYVMQRDRTDWPDGWNLLYGVGADLDWRRIVANVADDRPLLAGLVSAFSWICPERASQFPAWLWSELGLLTPSLAGGEELVRRRAALLDSRQWFTPTLDENDERLSSRGNEEATQC